MEEVEDKIVTAIKEECEMGSVTATFINGRVELTEPVDWPEGIEVEVTPLSGNRQSVDWLSLPPLDVGEFREVTAQDDLLEEMLDDHPRT